MAIHHTGEVTERPTDFTAARSIPGQAGPSSEIRRQAAISSFHTRTVKKTWPVS